MLKRLQDRLERIYELEIGLQADDYLVTDYVNSRDMNVALYLPPDILNTLENDHPMDNLHEGNIKHFLISLEAVSHFMYLAWNGYNDHPVSLFELELQSEVDKYISTMILIANQSEFYLPQGVLTRLFLQHPFVDDTNTQEDTCYRQANYYAYQYCKALQQNCIEEEQRSLFDDLRAFYRLNSVKKIDHITEAI